MEESVGFESINAWPTLFDSRPKTASENGGLDEYWPAIESNPSPAKTRIDLFEFTLVPNTIESFPKPVANTVRPENEVVSIRTKSLPVPVGTRDFDQGHPN